VFEVHQLNTDGMNKAKRLQRLFQQFLSDVEEICIDDDVKRPGGREMAIVRTNLETASFYAKRAMAMQPENHDEVIG
jgi:hypothetical protein